MTAWIVGDIHGCARELEALIDNINLGPSDRLICVGDLFHRGPDPVGVMEILEDVGASFVLGNHELRVLQRCNLAPRNADVSDRPPLRTEFPPLEAQDFAGDGDRPCEVPEADRARCLTFLQSYAGFYISSTELDGVSGTPDGRPWWVVHAGIQAGRPLEANSIRTLTRARRTGARGEPYWYESWHGPALVLFGHTPGRVPRARMSRNKLVALGLDTSCVYGGSLTAYAPEIDEVRSVSAIQTYARV